jgi:3-oxoacyl-[acyl-carrier-protein] synthase-1
MRPIFIAAMGHASALGLSAASAGAVALAERPCPAWRDLPDGRYPWFTLPLSEAAWMERARRALALVGDELAAGCARTELAALPLFVGSSAQATGEVEARARLSGRVNMSPSESIAIFSHEVAAVFGAAAPPWLFSTACTSGFAALEAACALIGTGETNEALALGVEFDCDTTLAGFASLGLLAHGEEEDGLILGEAVAGLRLTARPCGAWRIAACRLSLDEHSVTTPAPDGAPIAANLAAALADAGLTAADIDLLKPHRGRLAATDEAEAAALRQVFGERLPPEITFKRHFGHTLGACGPAELTALLAVLATPAGQAHYGRPRHVLLNVVGFGGSLATVIVSRRAAEEGA